MPKITILCGLSPLPVCQALKTLEATEVVIIHGLGRSENVAKRVQNYCRDTLKIDESKVQLVEVDGLDPLKCLETMSDIRVRELLASSALVYGPGTSVMNAMIHEVWRSAVGNELNQGQSWYIHANPSRLLPSNKSEELKKVVPTGLDSEGLIKLDGDESYAVVLGENMDPFATSEEDDDSKKVNEDDDSNKVEEDDDPIKKAKKQIGQGVEEILYNGTGLAANLPTLGREWLQNFDPKFQNGFFMEAVIFQVLKKAFKPDQVFHSVKAFNQRGECVLEMDVLLRKGDNLLWISSHNNSTNNKWHTEKKELIRKVPTTEFRKKFFEAKENALRLSGKEARSITIVNRPIQSIPKGEFRADPYEFEDRIENGKGLRRRVGVLGPENGGEREYTIADRHIIVDLAELLGENPVGTVTNTPELLEGCATPELSGWINNALNH